MKYKLNAAQDATAPTTMTTRLLNSNSILSLHLMISRPPQQRSLGCEKDWYLVPLTWHQATPEHVCRRKSHPAHMCHIPDTSGYEGLAQQMHVFVLRVDCAQVATEYKTGRFSLRAGGDGGRGHDDVDFDFLQNKGSGGTYTAIVTKQNNNQTPSPFGGGKTD
uniref:Uncharacterized protein n=1 Tax=Anopheles coluzzii TaxID=1518534 RepID=A0A8W7PK22_ANOCL